ncbi:hypothetical protein [Halobacillus halophilus]|uniref:hypothetical protein n=1 Tax=Halobacillus halophilus TaxID=1570 RepID=UPI001CD7318E|nr:hypothetical protein [Halobacillus halophilus]MCA1010705.1 hypothetical protein [Halobacillus halophilus]
MIIAGLVLLTILLLVNAWIVFQIYTIKSDNKQKYEKVKEDFNTTSQELLRNLMEKNIDNQKELLQEIQTHHAQTYENLIDFNKENVLEWLKKAEEKNAKHMAQLKERLDAYLKEEIQDQDQWLELIQSKQGSSSEKLDIIESALNKYPSYKEFVNEYLDAIQPFMESRDSKVKKKVIERLNRVSRVFLDNCRSEDYNFAKDLHMKTLEQGYQFMKETNENYKEKVKMNMGIMENTINILSKKKHRNPEMVKELERIDQQIDRQWIQNQPELRERYNELSKQSMKLFSPVEIDDEQIDQYNEEAIRSIEQAYNKLQANSYYYTQGKRLYELTRLLGGWNMQYLSVPTQTYYQSVYSEAFAKIKPEVKPLFTKQVLQTTKKEVS